MTISETILWIKIMKNLNYPLRVSKNKPPSVFRTDKWWNINEEKTENNLVFCIDPRKTFAIKSISRSVFRNPSHKNKIRLFSISVKLWFRFLYKTMTKQTAYLDGSLTVILLGTKCFFFVYMYIDVLKLKAYELFENSDADLSRLLF